VVEEVVAAREAVTWFCALAVAEVAEVRSSAVTVHTVGFTLVTKQTGSGGKLHTDTCLLVAPEGFQMRVDVLAR
jgi:hypothetical protein